MIEYITTEEDGFLHGLLVRLTLLAADFGDKLMHHVNGQKTGRRSDAWKLEQPHPVSYVPGELQLSWDTCSSCMNVAHDTQTLRAVTHGPTLSVVILAADDVGYYSISELAIGRRKTEAPGADFWKFRAPLLPFCSVLTLLCLPSFFPLLFTFPPSLSLFSLFLPATAEQFGVSTGDARTVA